MKIFCFLFAALCFSSQTFAQINQPKDIQTSQQFGKYTVHYTVFNSKQITPSIAASYKLTRAKDIALINISLTTTENGVTSLGLPAQVKANAVNLMQQTQTLSLQEIKEPDATYYLASFRHNNEDDLRFDVSVLPVGETTPLKISFNRRLYTEN